ncbi:MAG: GNAT family N-acetyltransferase [Bacteroidota bacterium]
MLRSTSWLKRLVVQQHLELPIVVDEELSLNLLHLRDAEALFELVEKNRPYLRAWLPWLDTIQSPKDQEVFIQKTHQQWAAKQSLILGIGYQQQLVGMVSFNIFDWEHKTAQIGYWLDAAHQGKGIMTRACQAMVDIAFEKLGLKALTIGCATENYKSQAIPLRLGFVWHQTIPNSEWLYDHYVDHHMYLLEHPLLS